MKVKIINKSKNENPVYAKEGDAGFDLRANLENIMEIKPGEIVLVPTGLFMQIPTGFEGQVRSRSGLSLKKGLVVLNSPGTVDSSYRGEVKIILINHSKEVQKIENSERVAQMVISKHETVIFELVNDISELTETERGAGGFGHTDSKK